MTPGQGPVFDDSSMMIEAAVDGQGVGLARGALAVDDLAAGRLAKPFKLALTSPLAYYLVCPEGAAQRPKIAAFRNWLLAEAGAPPRAKPKRKRRASTQDQHDAARRRDGQDCDPHGAAADMAAE